MATALGKLHGVLLALRPINRLLLFKNVLHFYTVLPGVMVFIITLSILENIFDRVTMDKRIILAFPWRLRTQIQERKCFLPHPRQPQYKWQTSNRVTWKMTERKHASKRTPWFFPGAYSGQAPFSHRHQSSSTSLQGELTHVWPRNGWSPTYHTSKEC